jgi:uncharacterized protein
MTDPSRPQFLGLFAGLFLAAGLVVSTMLATTAWLKVRNTQLITVKGSARKNIKSDLVVWRGNFTTQAATLLEAQRNLMGDADKVAAFLQARAVTNFQFTPISIQEIQGSLETNGLKEQKILGYRLTQTVRIESADVERITSLDYESTALVKAGVLFTALPPQFIYTKADEAKVEMLTEATKDARVRAEQIAAQGGRSIARLQTAQMGVMQIAPIYSGQTSWQGVNDIYSLDKTITAVVTATFALK